jgi:hypothetical protein
MHHNKSKFPAWQNASRREVSTLFAPYSPYCLMSLAKLFRGEDVVVGNSAPVLARRDRPGLAPRKRGGRNLHGRGCSACNPRQGRPRKPYDRARLRGRLED